MKPLRTFIHKDCDRAVFGPLYSFFPNNIPVGSHAHDFFSSTLERLAPDAPADYERDDLTESEMTPQEMYDYIYLRIGTEGYLGAIETTSAQAGLMQDYETSLNPEDGG